MIKWFSMLLLLMVGTISASAQTIALEDFSIKAGETKDVAITVSEAVYGIQTDVTLSEGLSLVSAASAQEGLSFSQNEANGRMALLSLSGAQITAGDAITMQVKAADSFTAGTISLKNTYLTTDNLGTEVKPADVTANVTLDQTPEPTPEYYIVGSMTDWAVNADYKMALNSEAQSEEYTFTADMTAGSEFKVMKVLGETQTWYPDGMGNNYSITNAGNYTIYFRPNYDGGDDWFYNCIFVASNDEPIAEATWTLAGSAESLFGGHWWFDEEASVNNMEKDDGHVWTKTYTNKLLTGIVYYGVFKNHGTDEYYPAGLNPEDLEGTAQQLTVDGIGYYDVTFTFNDETHALSAQATKKGDYTITSVVVNGNSSELFNGDLVLAETSAGVWTGTIEAKQLSAGTIQFGATINNENVLNPTGSLTITEVGKYDVAFTYTVATNKITAEATLWVEQPETYAIVGELTTGGWNDAGTEPDAAVMTLQDNGLYTYVVESFAAQAKTYQYKLRANNKWGVFELPSSGNNEYTFTTAGKYKLTFTANVTGEAIDEVAAYTLTLKAEKIEEPQPVLHTYTIAGDAAIANGKQWDVAAEENLMVQDEQDATKYTLKIEGAKIAAGTYSYKVVVDNSWDNQSIPKGANAQLTVDADGIYTIDYTLTLGEVDGELGTVTAVATQTGDWVVTKKYRVSGTEALTGVNWGDAEDVNLMTENGEGLYTITFENKELEASSATNTYEYKIVVFTYENDVLTGKSWRPSDNQVVNIPEAGKYNVTITFNPATEECTSTAVKVEEPQPELNTYTVTFDNGGNWEEVYAYVWSDEGENKVLGDWPGTKLEKNAETGLYDVTIQAEAAPEFIIFNNGNGGEGNQTADLAFENGKAYTYEAPVVEQPETFAIVGELTGGWNDNATDPDAAVMTKQDNGLYTYVLDSFTAEAKAYQYRMRANNKWGVFDLPSNGNQTYTFEEAGNYKLTFTANVTDTEIDGVAAYTLTLEAQKNEEPQPEPDAEITSVQLQGDWNWQSGKEALTLEAGEANTYTGVLDLTDITGDQKFKLVVNGGGDESDGWKGWIGTNNLTVDAPENWVVATAETTNANCTLNNATTGYQTYTITATWTPSPDYAAGWTLKIEGKDVRPEVVSDDYTVTFVNNPEWEEVYAYAWSGEGDSVDKPLGEWPGTKMTIVAEAKADVMKEPAATADVYTVTFNAETMPEYIIFNNGKSGDELKQTENLAFVNENEYTYEEPVVEDATWTIAGAPEAVFGTSWDAANTNNDMVKQTDGTFKWEKDDLALPEGNIEFKVVKNHDWNAGSYPSENYLLPIAESGIYAITITFDPETTEVDAVATKTGSAEVETTYVVAGSLEALFGSAWDGTAEANKMEKQADGTYKKAYTDIVIPANVTDIQYKIVKNGSEWIGDANGNNIIVSVNAGGTYDFTFTFDPETNVPNCEAVRTDAPAEPDTWTVAGVAELLGVAWDVTAEANDMTSEDNTNWTLTKTDLFLAKGTYMYKVAKNHSWAESYGDPQSGDPDNNAMLTITEPATYTVVFSFNSDTKAVSAVATKTADYVITSYNVVGSSEELFGEQWNVALNPMTKGEGEIYTWTKEKVQLTAGDIEYKVAANGEWIVSYPEGDNNKLTIEQDGWYNVTITLDLTGEAVVTATADKWAAAPEGDYYVVGDAGLISTGWDKSVAGKMTQNADDTYTLTLTDVMMTAGEGFEFKVTDAEGNWYPDGEGNNLTIDAPTSDGIFTITFVFDPFIGETTVSIERTGDVPTAITLLQAAIENGEAVVFDLNGRRVYTAKRGVFIINGQKRVIK